MEDREIIRLFFHREESAVTQLQNKFGGFCYSIAKNILESVEDTEECIWDVYLKVWNSIPPQNPDNLKVWLGKVVRNCALNLWDKKHAKKRFSEAVVPFDELQDCIPDFTTPERVLEKEELGEVISRWLKTLNNADRNLFIRRYWLCEPLCDIARANNINEKKLAKRMYILRKNLKIALEREGICL